MEYETIKQEFYELYEEYRDFIQLLEDEQSDGLAILCFSYRILDEYFKYGDETFFPSSVYEFLIDTEHLLFIYNFFKDRIDYLYNIYTDICDEDLDVFNEIMPNVYYFLSLNEILDCYKFENIDDSDKIQEVLNEIINVSQTIDDKTPLEDSLLDSMDVKLNYLLPHPDSIIPTNIVFSVYESLVEDVNDDDEDNDNEEEDDDKDFLSTLNLMLVDMSNRYGNLILSLDHDKKLYKNITLYKSILEKLIDVIRYSKDNVDTLEEYFGCTLEFITCFYPTIYVKQLVMISILSKTYNDLSIIEARADDIIRCTEIEASSAWIKQVCDDYENLNEFTAKIVGTYLGYLDSNKQLPVEIIKSGEQLLDAFFEITEFEYESINELTLDLYKKICDKYNETLN